MGAVGVGIAGVYLTTGFGIPCPLAQMGILCPFCGGTRMVAALVRGDVVAALHWNPFLFVGGIVAGVASVAWVVEVLGGPRLRLPASWGPMTQRRLYLVGGVVAAVFMVVRNLA